TRRRNKPRSRPSATEARPHTRQDGNRSPRFAQRAAARPRPGVRQPYFSPKTRTLRAATQPDRSIHLAIHLVPQEMLRRFDRLSRAVAAVRDLIEQGARVRRPAELLARTDRAHAAIRAHGVLRRAFAPFGCGFGERHGLRRVAEAERPANG